MNYQQVANSILLKRSNKLITPNTGFTQNHNAAMALMVELSQYGYTMDENLFKAVESLNDADIATFTNDTMSVIGEITCGDKTYTPLFKNFPKDVPNGQDYFNERIIGYISNFFNISPENCQVLSCGHVIDKDVFNMNLFGACPICQKQVDEVTPNEKGNYSALGKVKIISLASEEDIHLLFKRLVSSKVSLNKDDYNDIENILSIFPNEVIPVITSREIFSKMSTIMFNLHDYMPIDWKSEMTITATDVLRIAAALSDQDISLGSTMKFKNFKNKERRFLLSLLDTVKNPTPDMKKYKEEWKRLGERIHPGSYKDKFKNAAQAFDTIRNNEKSIVTFMSDVESKIINNDINNAADKLKERPSEFIRRMDKLLRESNDHGQHVLTIFKDVIKDIPNTLLFQVMHHFAKRHIQKTERYFTPKSERSIVFYINNEHKSLTNYKHIDNEISDLIVKVIKEELKTRYSTKSQQKRVFIHPSLKKCPIPLVKRNLSTSLHTVARGTKLSFEKKDIIRLFIYWKGLVDLDIGAICYDNNLKEISSIYYGNQKDKNDFGLSHSGDIQSAPNGATEFIDIDIEKALSTGVKYVSMTVISFTGEPFEDFQAFSGVMAREYEDSDEIFEPSTVLNKFDIKGKSKSIMPIVLDLENMEIIYADIDGLSNNRYSNQENNKDKFLNLMKYILELSDIKPNLYNLFKFNSLGRGAIVDTIFDEAKTYDAIYSIYEGITPFDIDLINSEYL
jgi:hypothetical protein